MGEKEREAVFRGKGKGGSYWRKRKGESVNGRKEGQAALKKKKEGQLHW